jgi:hypothetical protein
MARRPDFLAGDGEFSDDGRALTPYQKRRELRRRGDAADAAYELYARKLWAINKGTQHKLHDIIVTGACAKDTAQQGEIQAALTAEAMVSYNAMLKAADYAFLRDLED